jgi:hypothetical protein
MDQEYLIALNPYVRGYPFAWNTLITPENIWYRLQLYDVEGGIEWVVNKLWIVHKKVYR